MQTLKLCTGDTTYVCIMSGHPILVLLALAHSHTCKKSMAAFALPRSAMGLNINHRIQKGVRSERITRPKRNGAERGRKEEVVDDRAW